MTETMHAVDQGWRDAAAHALETKALSVADLLAHVDNVVELAADDHPEAVAELRQVAGRWRSYRNDYVREAGRYRDAQ